MTSPIAGEREAFEAWARPRCHDLSRVDDDYSIVRTHVAWLAWQARAALSAPAVETVAVQEAIADERKSWADASAHDKEIASLALDCLAHRLTCRTPLPVAPKAEPTDLTTCAHCCGSGKVKHDDFNPTQSNCPHCDGEGAK